MRTTRNDAGYVKPKRAPGRPGPSAAGKVRGEFAVVRGAVHVAENDQAAARADGDGIADTFSGFAAFGLRVTKKGGDVHTASSRNRARPRSVR